MAFPSIPLPSIWNVPTMIGVPALLGQSIGNGVSASISSILGQEVANIQTQSAAAQWGIFQKGKRILTAAHVCGIEFERRYQISTAPTENGDFVSYNKAKFPFLTRILMVCDGTESGSILSGGLRQVLGSITGSGPQTVRKSFFDTLEQITKDTNLYEVHMPEASYKNANVAGYRFRRTEREGVTMPVVEIELQEVRDNAVLSSFGAASRVVSASSVIEGGQVQLQKLPKGLPSNIIPFLPMGG